MKALTANISGWFTTAIFFTAFCLFCEPLSAKESGKDTSSFYHNRKQGFYWYQDDQIPKEDKKKTQEQLYTMKPEEFRKLLSQRLETAVQYPTQQNVYDYMVMLDISKKKAQTFSSVMAWVGKQHPELSNQTVFPVTAPGQKAWFSDARKDMEDTLANVRDRFALIVFSSESCSYCTAQDKILGFFQKQYNWNIKKLDLIMHQNLAQRFGVTMVPSIILLDKDTQKVLPVSTGVVSMDELKNSIYQSVLMFEGKITPEQYGLALKTRQAALADQ